MKKDGKKSGSIARRINGGFIAKTLGRYFFLNLILLVGAALVYLCWCAERAGIPVDGLLHDGGLLVSGKGLAEWTLTLVAGDGTSASFAAGTAVRLVFPLFCVVFGWELLSLLSQLTYTGHIRRRLRPLNELAIKAEMLSGSDGSEKMEHLRQAIYSVSADAAEIQVRTGDKDLQSIEIAINNLLQKMQDSQKQQTRFVSDASHELRTPISVIQGYVNMLDRWGKDDPAVLAEAIEALKNESTHMKELVEQLLFLARGDSGRNKLNLVQLDLCDLMQEVWEESAMIDDKHEYRLKLPQEGRFCLRGDAAMIKQAVRIFVQNAAKYTPEGGVITLGVQGESGRVSYTVQDEGIGIKQSDVEHIFERFYRADDTRTSSTGGSGLGLSIAKWIIDAHAGTIEVISRLDLGTRFTVSLPAAENESAEA